MEDKLRGLLIMVSSSLMYALFAYFLMFGGEGLSKLLVKLAVLLLMLLLTAIVFSAGLILYRMPRD